MRQKSKTQNVTKLKNSKFYNTQQLKYNKNKIKLQNWKNQFVTNIIRLYFKKKKKLINLKLCEQIETSSCYKTQKLKL